MKIEFDPHVHTLASEHAYSTVKECIEEAAIKNLKGIAFTDHTPSMKGAPSNLFFLNLKVLPKELMGVQILSGAELNILNNKGEVDLPTNTLKRLMCVIASIHLPCYSSGGFDYNTDAVLNCMDNPYINIIGHLGDPRFEMDYEKIIGRARKKDVFIEINDKSADPGSGIRAGSIDNLRTIIKLCVKNEVYMTLGSDSHFYTEVGDLSAASHLVKEIGAPERLILNTDFKLFKNILLKKREKIKDYKA